MTDAGGVRYIAPHDGEASPLLSQDEEIPKHSYGTVIAVAMLLNYIIGTGCFSLPYAFTQAGLVLTGSLVLGGAVVAVIGSIYTLNVLARGNGVRTVGPGEDPYHHIGAVKLDFPDVAGIFYGDGLRKTTQVIIFLYGSPWAHGAILASSMGAFIVSYIDPTDTCNIYENPSVACMASYYGSLAVFAIYGLAMVTLDLGEQATIQQLMTFYRIFALGVMYVTLSIKLYHDWDILPQRISTIGSARWSLFAAGFGPAFNSMANQYCLPDVLQPMRDKSKARGMSNTAFTISAIVYFALGLMGALAFDNVNRLVSMNWASYTGCGSGWDPCQEHNVWGGAVQVFVSLFPVINVMSTFALQSVTVGDALSDLIPQAMVDCLGLSSHATKVASRWVVGLGAYAVAAFLIKLDKVFTALGIMGILLGLVLTSALELKSRTFCSERWGPQSVDTPYTTSFICNWWFVRLFNIFSWGVFFLAIFTMPS